MNISSPSEKSRAPDPAAVTAAPLPRGAKAALAALGLAFVLQTGFLVFDKSPTTDEISFHMVNGYLYLVTRDFRMSPATPPFLREWMALPWLVLKPSFDLESASWKEADSVPFAVDVVYKKNRAGADLLLHSARLMMLPLGLALGWGIFAWSRRLHGTGAGLVSLALFAFCPTIVGHAALAGVDVGAALFYFFTVYFLHEWRELRGASGFPWKAAAALGLGLASKFTLVLIVPAAFFLIALKGSRARAGVVLRGTGTFALFTTAALLVTWAAYFFETKPLLRGVPRVEEKIGYVGAVSDALFGGSPEMKRRLIAAASETPVPLPSFFLGFAGIARSHRDEYMHFFAGKWSEETVWYHYLVSFAFKTTLGFLALLTVRAALGLSRFFRRRREPASDYLLLPPAVLFAATFFDSTGVGIRYLIPAMPFLFVWIGALWRPGVFSRALVAALVAAHAGASLAAFPDNLAYFNAAAGGAEGGMRWVRGSDLDWGQELKNLGRWAREERIGEIKTHLFGTRDEAFYGIRRAEIKPGEYRIPERAVYAITADYLDAFEWTAREAPSRRIGGVIWIYDFRAGVPGGAGAEGR